MRIQNFTSSEICHSCRNGLAQTGTRPSGTGEVPEFGPCPFCELGERLEFSKVSGWLQWGQDGYWRGREPEVVVPSRSFVQLSRQENALRMRLLARRYEGQDVDPCVGIDFPDEKRRMSLLTRAAR